MEKSQALRTKQIENDTGSQARRNNSNEYQRSLPGLLTQARSLWLHQNTVIGQSLYTYKPTPTPPKFKFYINYFKIQVSTSNWLVFAKKKRFPFLNIEVLREDNQYNEISNSQKLAESKRTEENKCFFKTWNLWSSYGWKNVNILNNLVYIWNYVHPNIFIRSTSII